MSINAVGPSSYGDFAQLNALKDSKKSQSKEAIEAVAQQFESLFTRMMLKSMRATSFDDSMNGGQGGAMAQDMFDDQLAIELSKGKGMGLADMLVQQLTRAGLVSDANGLTGEAAALKMPARPVATGPVAATGTAASGDAGFKPQSREEFVRELWPIAKAAGEQLGVEPSTLIAQAALETGWGKHMPADSLGRSSLNLFGIKATGKWNGDSVGAKTIEFSGGVAQVRNEPFRAYKSTQESFGDYVALVRDNPRYRAALGTGGDAAAFGQALQRGGYATDPEYGQKLARVAGQVTELVDRSFKVSARAPIQAVDGMEIG